MEPSLRELLAQLGVEVELDVAGDEHERDLEVIARLRLDDRTYVLLAAANGATRQRLTPRELQVARLIADGHTNRSAAALLGISPWTVSTYVRRSFEKLGVNSRGALVSALHHAGHDSTEVLTRLCDWCASCRVLYRQRAMGALTRIDTVDPSLELERTPKQQTGDRGENAVVRRATCPRCGGPWRKLPANTPVVDVRCRDCGFAAQVKAVTLRRGGRLPGQVLGAAWGPQRRRVGRDGLYVVGYSPAGRLVRMDYVSPASIRRHRVYVPRPAITRSGRSDTWRGFRIRLDRLPRQAIRRVATAPPVRR